MVLFCTVVLLYDLGQYRWNCWTLLDQRLSRGGILQRRLEVRVVVGTGPCGFRPLNNKVTYQVYIIRHRNKTWVECNLPGVRNPVVETAARTGPHDVGAGKTAGTPGSRRSESTHPNELRKHKPPVASASHAALTGRAEICGDSDVGATHGTRAGGAGGSAAPPVHPERGRAPTGEETARKRGRLQEKTVKEKH